MQKPRLRRRQARLEDGRVLVYYSFVPVEAEPKPPAAPPVRRL